MNRSSLKRLSGGNSSRQSVPLFSEDGRQHLMGNMNKEIKRSTISIMDLPMDFFISVLLQLCARSIISCKCVCKAWRSLITSHEFAKLHLSQQKTSLLIRNVYCTCYSRTLYLLEPENYSNFNFLKCWCQPCYNNRGCSVTMLNDKLKIPLRNSEAITDLICNYNRDHDTCFYKTGPDCIHASIKKKLQFHRYNIANSCDGLLFLIEPSLRNSVAICNPITGEFICYPLPANLHSYQSFFMNGLGFSPKNNQYKMVRMSTRELGSAKFDGRICVQVHTIGTHRWRSQHRNIACLPISLHKLHPPTYFCGVLHWVFIDNSNDSNGIVLCFDLDDESIYFHNIPISPPCKGGKGHILTLGVLEDRFCLFDNISAGFECDILEIWMMKDYAMWNSWTKVFSRDVGDDRGHCKGIHIPVSYKSNVGLLIFNSYFSEFIYYDHLERLLVRRVEVADEDPYQLIEVIVHTPSFISLKDIAAGGDDIQNVNFRCGDLELEEESHPVFIGPKMLGMDFCPVAKLRRDRSKLITSDLFQLKKHYVQKH